MSGPENPDDFDALLREHGGLQGLAWELGQFDGAAPMTDQQFRSLILHVRVVIILLGVIAGILLGIAWGYR